MGDKLPIDCISWRVMPSSNKDDVWDYIQFLKTGATLDRGDLFIRTRMKKAGGPVNDESAAMIDKIRDIKLTQQSTTSSSIASVGDAYEQVMGWDRTGRIHGIGIGPTPKSLWGSRSSQKLRQDNESLKEKIEALEERMKKIESRGNNESSASVCHAQKKKDSLAGRRVRILNFFGEVVANDILMSDDNDNVVMGKKLGGEYYEVSILIAHDPTASLFIKDADRKNMNDAVGSHIIWFREYHRVLVLECFGFVPSGAWVHCVVPWVAPGAGDSTMCCTGCLFVRFVCRLTTSLGVGGIELSASGTLCAGPCLVVSVRLVMVRPFGLLVLDHVVCRRCEVSGFGLTSDVFRVSVAVCHVVEHVTPSFCGSAYIWYPYRTTRKV
ncbi:hypothetical protein Taro_043874 [Colocasia esculenta]|uniref:Transposase n=1 Tax=Colocasia esculenta TaxID=4460 RepID=A0A843X1K0_COLES|nr:hypothetical protein [Colocasia esculenta]